jgi:hypothetical protein
MRVRLTWRWTGLTAIVFVASGLAAATAPGTVRQGEDA